MLQGGNLKFLKQQTRTITLNSSDITNTDLEAWPVVHTVNHTRCGYSFPVNLVTWAAIKLLARRVLKTPSEPQVVMLRFGVGSCGSPWVINIGAPGHASVGNRKMTLNRTKPIASGNVGWMSPDLGAIILSYERVVTGVALIIPTTGITGGP